MTRIKKFCAALEESGSDGAIISSGLNQRYLSGFDYTDGYIFATPSKAYLLADFRYIEAARREVSSEDFEIIMPEGSMLIELASLIEENSAGTVLIEESALSCASFSRFSEAFGKVKLAGGASGIIDRMRETKDDDELVLIGEAQKITDAAFSHILDVMTPDMTEIDVALELEFFMRRNGAEGVAFDTIAVSGSASSMPHGVPRNVKLQRGFLTMDFGAKHKGYCSDMTRTVVIGKADADMKKLYNTVLEAQLAALDYLAEGVECRLADKRARDIINSAGYEGCFGHSLGHGVGMYIHEAPRLAQSAPSGKRLCRGNVVTVEPGIYLSGKYGCRIEDMVAVDNQGKIKNFTKSKKELIELF